jgi:hypothetical protein
LPKNYVASKDYTDLCKICLDGQALEKKQSRSQEEEQKFEDYKRYKELKLTKKNEYKMQLQRLKANECLILMDFKANMKHIKPVGNNEDFFSNNSVSIFNITIIEKINAEENRQNIQSKK